MVERELSKKRRYGGQSDEEMIEMPTGVYPRKPLTERFWEKVDKRGPDECWRWTAGKNRAGYGTIKVCEKTEKAHRISWEIHHGPIPEGMCVLHHCDNPACVNPVHLWLGDRDANNRDMTEKGRRARGEAHGISELTEQDVHGIHFLLDAGHSQRAIAYSYGVDQKTISRINTGETWGWLK